MAKWILNVHTIMNKTYFYLHVLLNYQISFYALYFDLKEKDGKP